MADPIQVGGVLVTEDELTGDGRRFMAGAIRWDGALPLPILFDSTDEDHTGATVGQIREVQRVGDDIVGFGELSGSRDPATVAAVNRAAELLDEGAVGVSVAVDSFRGNVEVDMDAFPDLDDDDGTVRIPVAFDDLIMSFSEARLRHVAIVNTPAFTSASLRVLTGALVASASLDRSHLFDDPRFGIPGDDPRLKFDPGTGRWSCPLTIEGDRVYGHVAPIGVCLRGRPDTCVTPPEGDLEGFMRHYAPAAAGRRTGVVVLGGSHADIGIGVIEASRFYDQTGRAAADIRVGRDPYGIWFAGMLRPGITAQDRYTLAASDVSGHWEIDQRGRPTLVGLPAVNVGGFPKGYLSASEVEAGLAASTRLDGGCVNSRLDVLESVVAGMLSE